MTADCQGPVAAGRKWHHEELELLYETDLWLSVGAKVCGSAHGDVG